MKKLLTLAALSGLLASNALAFVVDVNRPTPPGWFTIPGGEFTVTAHNPPDAAFNAIYNNYVPATQLNGGFQTFCLSLSTPALGNPENATLVNSGVASGTAFLYNQFARGTLGGYNYVGTRAASAAELQAAIWFLQGSPQWEINALGGAFTSFNAATDMFVLDAAGATGTYGVEQLQLSTLAGLQSQPMLALVNIPDGGSTIMLLGFALSGFGLLARRIRR
jgi:hypothetical protein